MHVFAVVPRTPAAAPIHLRCSALVLLVALTGASCGESRLPTAPSTIGPQRTVAGSVQDASFRPIAGAQVAIVGTGLSTVTGADGSFELTGGISSPLTVRVAKEGYVPETRAADWPTCTPPPGSSLPCPLTRIGMLFSLESLGQAVDISGDYTMTLAADSACQDLPGEARSSTFTASIVPFGATRTRYVVTVQAPSLRESAAFEAGVTGDFLALRFNLDPGLIDQIAPNTYVLVGGSASATVLPGASLIAATFDGLLEYCHLKDSSTNPVDGCSSGSSALAEPTPSQPVNFAGCQSRDHRLTFTRR